MGGASRSAEGLPLPDPGGPLCARLQPGGGRLRPRGAAHRSRRHSEPGIAPPAQPPPRSPAGKRRPRDRHCAREHKPAHAAPGIRSRLGLALHAGAVPPRSCRGRALRRNGEDGRGLDRGYAVREGRADHSPSRPGSGRPQGPPFRPALRAPRPAPRLPAPDRPPPRGRRAPSSRDCVRRPGPSRGSGRQDRLPAAAREQRATLPPRRPRPSPYEIPKCSQHARRPDAHSGHPRPRPRSPRRVPSRATGRAGRRETLTLPALPGAGLGRGPSWGSRSLLLAQAIWTEGGARPGPRARPLTWAHSTEAAGCLPSLGSWQINVATAT